MISESRKSHFVSLRSIFSFLACLLLLATGCSEREKVSSPADFDMNISDKTSIAYLSDLIRRRPENADNYLRLAQIYFDAGNLKMAQRTLHDAEGKVDERERIELELTRYYLESGEIAIAETHFNNISALEGSIDYQIIQAALLVHKGFYDRAMQVITSSLAKDPGHSRLYYLRAVAQRSMADTVAALESYEKAVYCKDVGFSTVIEYLDYLVALDQVDQFFSKYSALPPHLKSRAETKLILTNVYVNEGKLDSAQVVLHSIDELDALGEKYLILAKVHLDQREYDSARYYAELSNRQDNTVESKLLLARVNDITQNYQAAEDIYQEILEADSTQAIAREELEKLRRKIRYLRELKMREQRRREREFVPLQPITPIN